MECSVCGREDPNTVVAGSSVGAVSFAYCPECLGSGREPYGLLTASLMGMTCMEDIAEWYRPIVLVTLKVEGKTVEEFFADTVTLMEEYREAVASVSTKITKVLPLLPRTAAEYPIDLTFTKVDPHHLQG